MSALYRSIVPFRSYAQMAAQRDQDLKYASALAEQSHQDQMMNEQRIQTQQETLAKMKSLPFEAPDQQKIKHWWNGKEKEIAKRIEMEYNGDVKKFNETEGLIWLQNSYSELVNTDMFHIANRNKEMVAMAKAAIDKEKNLIGRLGDDGKYISAEQDLLNFYSGANPTFSFYGSYDPKSTIYDHFGKMDNQYGSKFDRNAFVSEDDMLNYLRTEKGDRAGMDLYFRQFQGRKVPFKRYSIEDQDLFNLNIQDKNSQIEARDTQAQAALIRAQALAKKDAAENSINGFTDATQLITSMNIGTTPFDQIADPNLKLNNLGVNVGELATRNSEGKSGLEFAQISGLTLGQNFSKYTGIYKNGRVSGDVVLANGQGQVIDLSKIPHKVVGADRNIYVDQNEYDKSVKNLSLPGREFKKATVTVDRETAIKNGWISTSRLPFVDDKVSDAMKSARPTTNDGKIETLTFDVMVPSKGFFKSPEVKALANKSLFGQKRSNEIVDQVTNAMEEFQTNADSL